MVVYERGAVDAPTAAAALTRSEATARKATNRIDIRTQQQQQQQQFEEEHRSSSYSQPLASLQHYTIYTSLKNQAPGYTPPPPPQHDSRMSATQHVHHQAHPHEADVIVVGGGISGLRTASLLRAAGRRVLVLEAAPNLGGRCRVTPAIIDPLHRADTQPTNQQHAAEAEAAASDSASSSSSPGSGGNDNDEVTAVASRSVRIVLDLGAHSFNASHTRTVALLKQFRYMHLIDGSNVLWY
jgi:hypothetical protein